MPRSRNFSGEQLTVPFEPKPGQVSGWIFMAWRRTEPLMCIDILTPNDQPCRPQPNPHSSSSQKTPDVIIHTLVPHRKHLTS
jgi:hypothetical protein